MFVGEVISGSSEAGVMVCTPVPLMLKLMSPPPSALASWMASLSVQESHAPSGVSSPVSAVESTLKVLAWAGLLHSAKSTPISATAATIINVLEIFWFLTGVRIMLLALSHEARSDHPPVEHTRHCLYVSFLPYQQNQGDRTPKVRILAKPPKTFAARRKPHQSGGEG